MAVGKVMGLGAAGSATYNVCFGSSGSGSGLGDGLMASLG